MKETVCKHCPNWTEKPPKERQHCTYSRDFLPFWADLSSIALMDLVLRVDLVLVYGSSESMAEEPFSALHKN